MTRRDLLARVRRFADQVGQWKRMRVNRWVYRRPSREGPAAIAAEPFAFTGVLPRAAPTQDSMAGLPQDLEVEEERPVLDVVHI